MYIYVMRCFIVSLLLMGCHSLLAQRNKPIIDSLEKLALTQKDSALAATYNELTWQYRAVNRDKAFYYGQKAIELSTKINYLKGLAQAHNDLGILYMDNQDFNNAIISYDKALAIRQKLNDINGMAAVYLKKGIIYQRSGKYEKALENGFKALDLYETINNEYGIGSALHNVGVANQNIGNTTAALNYLKRSVAIKEKIKDKLGLAGTYLIIGNIYFSQDNYAEAKKYFEKSEEMAAAIGDGETLSVVYHNMAAWYERAGNPKDGLEYIEAAYDLRKRRQDIKGQVSSLNVWGSLLAQQQQYAAAEEKLQLGLKTAGNLESCLQEKGRIYRTLQSVYEQMGEYKKASDAAKQVVIFSDSIHTTSLTEKFAEAETRYQTLQKEKQIEQQQAILNKNLYDLAQQKLIISQNELKLAANALALKQKEEEILQNKLDSTQQVQRINSLKQENTINALQLSNEKLANAKKKNLLIALSIFSALIILLFYSYYRRYKLKKEKELQAAIFKEQELASKAILEAEENERKRIATELHDGVGQLMSAAKMNLSAIETELPFANPSQHHAYVKALNLVDESCKEVRAVSHAMMPNALLKAGLGTALKEFVNQIDSRVIKLDLYTEGLEQRLETNIETVLYRVIQECVNNVIKHAQATHLDISIIRDKNGVDVTIEDNGKGFDVANKNNFEGIGLKNIQTRVQYLKGTVEWHSAPGKGTLVAIHLPLG